MKKFVTITLIVLTIFVTYFYIPNFNGSSIQNVEKTLAAAADTAYTVISTCSELESISSFTDTYKSDTHTGVPTDFKGLKVIEGGNKIIIRLKEDYTYTYVTRIDDTAKLTGSTSSTSGFLYKNTSPTSKIVTNLIVENQLFDTFATILGANNAYPSDTDLANLGELGSFIKEIRVKKSSGSVTSSGFTYQAYIPVNLTRCKIFDSDAPLDLKMDGYKSNPSPSGVYDSPPTITIPWNKGGEKNKTGDREEIILKLKKVIVPSSGTTDGKIVFYFIYDKSKDGSIKDRFKYIGIKVFTDYSAKAVNFWDIGEPNDDSDTSSFNSISGSTQVNLTKGEVDALLFWLVFNEDKAGACGQAVGPKSPFQFTVNPNLNCLDTSESGYLAAWKINKTDGGIIESDFKGPSEPTATDSFGKDVKDDCPLGLIYSKGYFIYGLCGVAGFLQSVATEMMCFAQSWLQRSLSILDLSVGSSSTVCPGGETNMPDAFKNKK